MKYLIVLVIILTCFYVYAGSVRVDKYTSVGDGLNVNESVGISNPSTEPTETYWNTPMTDRWADAMTVDSLWTTAMNTEIS